MASEHAPGWLPGDRARPKSKDEDKEKEFEDIVSSFSPLFDEAEDFVRAFVQRGGE